MEQAGNSCVAVTAAAAGNISPNEAGKLGVTDSSRRCETETATLKAVANFDQLHIM